MYKTARVFELKNLTFKDLQLKSIFRARSLQDLNHLKLWLSKLEVQNSFLELLLQLQMTAVNNLHVDLLTLRSWNNFWLQ